MEKNKTENGKALKELVSAQTELTKFNEAIKSAGLIEKFSESASYTLFAPTNEAFNKLPEQKVKDLLKPENREQLKTLVLSHIVPGELTVDDLKKTEFLNNEAGRKINVDVSDDLKQIQIGNAKVTQRRAEGRNCCLYMIDAVLQPTASVAAA